MKNIIYNTKFLGNNYGGFPCDVSLLNKDSIILGFGVGPDISFDKDIIRLTDATVELFDFTPNSIKMFKGTKNTIFNEYGISDFDGMLEVFQDNPKVFSKWPSWLGFGKTESYPVKSISTIMKEKNINHIDLLKMDVEGEEYKVIPNMFDSKIFPTQICMEFHPFHLDGSIHSEDFISTAKEHGVKSHEEVFELILKYYTLAGRSLKNNKPDNEYCFILKEKLKNA